MEIDWEGSDNDVLSKLTFFNEQHTAVTSAVSLSQDEQRNLFENLLTKILANESRKACMATALTTIKILSRNKLLMNSSITAWKLDLLLSHAGLSGNSSKSKRDDLQNRDLAVIAEALRCLSNIYFQSSSAQTYGVGNSTMASVIDQTKRYKELEIPYEIISADLKLIFLITAHRPEARSVLALHHRGVSRLTDVLRLILDNAKDRADEGGAASRIPVLSDVDVGVVIDVMRVLFNVTITYDMEPSLRDEEEVSDLLNLAKLVNILLNVATETSTKKTHLVSNCINLLTNYPLSCLEPLKDAVDREFVRGQDIEYDGASMNSTWTVLTYLANILENCNEPNKSVPGEIRDSAVPALKALVLLAKSHRLIRRYLRYKILPPLKLKDVEKRPEEGSTIRNKLCRLLTNPDTALSTMAAELLFVLCKEQVGRFVKYTGYGNAAGLLARRGLMMGGASGHAYSSSSEDSDTEEYLQVENQVNPIMGCMESPNRPNPFAEMTEEQKEYEAVQLANAIDKLHSLGIVRPARVDDSGKPVPVDHVLQLVEKPECSIRRRRHENDDETRDSDDE